jgi:hypothetical protein
VSVSDDGESTGGGGTLQVLLFLEIVKIWCKPQDKIKLYLQQDLYDYVLLSVLTVFVFGADMAHEWSDLPPWGRSSYWAGGFQDPLGQLHSEDVN